MSKEKSKIIPRGEWLLIKPVVNDSLENENGLSIPANTEKEQKSQGTVEAVGDKVKGVKKDDVVVFGTFAGEQLKVKENGQEVDYKLILDEDIIAFIK